MKGLLLNLSWDRYVTAYSWNVVGTYTLLAETESAYFLKGWIFKGWYLKKWYRFQKLTANTT